MKLEDLERIVAHAQAAQAAVDELIKPKEHAKEAAWRRTFEHRPHQHVWNAAGFCNECGQDITTPKDGMAKIKQKVKPREYKTGPRRKGRAKLAHQLMKLTLDVSRFAMKPEITQTDREWAGNLLFQLQQLRHYQTDSYGDR